MLSSFSPLFPCHAGELDQLQAEGQKAKDASNYQEALKIFERCLELAKSAKDEEAVVRFLDLISELNFKLGRYDQALEYLQQGLVLARELKNREQERRTLEQLGLIYRDSGNSDKALEYLRQALALAKELKDRKTEAAILGSIGLVYMHLALDHKALTLHQESLSISREIKDRYEEARSLSNIGLTFKQLGQYDQALQYYQQALEINKEFHDYGIESVTLGNIGDVYLKQGQYDKALEYCQKAQALNKQIKYGIDEGSNLQRLGVIYDYLGQYDKAREYLQQALAISQKSQDRSLPELNLNSLGIVYFRLGQYEKALEYLQQSLAVARVNQERRQQADVLANIGLVYGVLGQKTKSLQIYQQVLALRKDLKDRSGEGAEQINIGQTYVGLGVYDKGREALRIGLKIGKELGESENIWRAQTGLGNVATKLGDYRNALVSYRQALDSIEALRTGLSDKETRISFMQGKLFVYDDLIVLLKFLHEKFPSQGYDRDSLEIFERKQGRVFLEEMGKSGARHFSGLPDAVKNQETETEVQLTQTQAALTKERSQPDPNPEQIQALENELQKLVTTLSNLKAEIRNKYPEYYALKYPQPATLEELQRKVLKPGEVILAYGVMADQTYLWMIGKEQFGLYTLPIKESDLVAKINNFRKERETILTALENQEPMDKINRLSQSSLEKMHPQAQELYKLLIPEGARKVVNAARLWYIVPTGPLYSLPFEALIAPGNSDSQKPRYLVEDHALAYLSSASLLKNLRESQARRNEKPTFPFLAFANPVYLETEASEGTTTISDPKQEPLAPANPAMLKGLRTRAYLKGLGKANFPELPETADEVRAISADLQAPEESHPLQLREAASRSNVLSLNQAGQLEKYRYLVFSCHGILPSEVDKVNQPALVLSNPDPQLKTEGFLTMADVLGLKLNADLVALSACNTGRGKVQKGEGVIGLTRAFMYSGTSAISVTLWSVESESVKSLSIGFFKNLKEGRGRAAALRESKLRLIRGEEENLYRHPFFWAPLVVFGEGD